MKLTKQNTINDVFSLLMTIKNTKISKVDAYQILEDVFNYDYDELIINFSQKVTTYELDKINKIIKKLKFNRPVAQILNKAYFSNRPFFINKHVLIPRDDSVLLINLANTFLSRNENAKTLDLCCGSGVLGISLKLDHPKISLDLSDISSKALKVTNFNLAKFNINDAKIIKGNFLKPLTSKYNLIICNPPYIAKKDSNLDKEVLKFEPKRALFAKNEGLFFFEQLFINFEKIIDLEKEFMLICEFGWQQKLAIEELFYKYFELLKIEFFKDLNNHFRAFIIRR